MQSKSGLAMNKHLITLLAVRDLLLAQGSFRPSPAKLGRPVVEAGDPDSLLPLFPDVRCTIRRKAQSKHRNEPIQSTVSYFLPSKSKCLL